MANIDKERITLLIGEIEKALGILIDYSEMNKEELLGDLKSLGSVKYYSVLLNILDRKYII